MSRFASGTIHYDMLADPTVAGDYYAQAAAKGHRRCLIVPQAAGDSGQTGTINDAAVLSMIANLDWLDDVEYGVLDFENPYFEHLAEGVSDLAAPNYLAARAEMIDLIQQVRAEYPAIKWAFYASPRPMFFVANSTWRDLEINGDTAAIDAKIDAYVAAYGPLIDESDFLTPQITDRYRPTIPNNDEKTNRFVHYAVETCNRYNTDRGTSKPIVPSGCPTLQYSNQGDAYIPRFIDRAGIAYRQIIPAIANGARTVLLWTGLNTWASWVFDLTNYPLDHVGHPNSAAVYRVNRYRLAFTDDFFNGVEPDWNSAADEETLRIGLCNRMISTMTDMQDMVRTKGAARRTTLETLGGLEPGPIG